MSAFYIDPKAPVQPDQFKVEFSELLKIFDKIEPKNILEIGVREGGTLYQWIKHAPKGARVVAVDLPDGPWGMRKPPECEEWLSWAKKYNVELIPIIGNSHSPNVVYQLECMAPFDFIFLDGDHSLTGMACDFLVYSRMLNEPGVIALHDILLDESDNRIETWRYWYEIENGNYKTKVLTSMDDQKSRGIGVVYV